MRACYQIKHNACNGRIHLYARTTNDIVKDAITILVVPNNNNNMYGYYKCHSGFERFRLKINHKIFRIMIIGGR